MNGEEDEFADEGFEEDKFEENLANFAPRKGARKRPPLFTETEIDVLTAHVNEKRHIVDNPATDASSVEKKNCTWRTIAALYAESAENLGISTPRTAQQLRKKWENMKATARKVDSEIIQHRLATGGGPELELDPEKQRILNAVKTVRPTINFTLSNNWDSTGEFESDHVVPPIQNAIPGHHASSNLDIVHARGSAFKFKQPSSRGPNNCPDASSLWVNPAKATPNKTDPKKSTATQSGRVDAILESKFKVFNAYEQEKSVSPCSPIRDPKLEEQHISGALRGKAPKSATVTSGEFINLVDDSDEDQLYVRSNTNDRSPLKNIIRQREAEAIRSPPKLSDAGEYLKDQNSYGSKNIGPFQKRLNMCQENVPSSSVKKVKSVVESSNKRKVDEETKMKYQEEIYQEKIEVTRLEKKYWLQRCETADIEKDTQILKREAAELKFKYYSGKVGLGEDDDDVGHQ